LNIDNSNFCTGKSDALYTVAGNCSAYVRCVAEEASVHVCREDFVFSDRRKECLPLTSVPERAIECASYTRYLLLALICCIICYAFIMCC